MLWAKLRRTSMSGYEVKSLLLGVVPPQRFKPAQSITFPPASAEDPLKSRCYIIKNNTGKWPGMMPLAI
ncbi:MAG: hypothetical protein KAQ72_14915 [Desulfobacula sp.]|nr:hypothetical protein [Desulfobacula sp.]